MWPQVILTTLLILSLGAQMAKHGEPRENYDVRWALFSFALVMILLYWGGFYDGWIK